MEKHFSFINSVSNATILTTRDGTILQTNKASDYLLKLAKKVSFNNVSEFLDEYVPDSNLQVHEINFVGNLKAAYRIYPFELPNCETLLLYIFEDMVTLSDLVYQVLEAIDEGVSIIDGDGNLEAANSTAIQNIGRDIAEFEEHIGQNLQQVLRENSLLKDALNPIVIKEKKIVRKNLKYSNNKVVTYTGTPLFKESGELNHVVLTGRDVSRLVQLESQLYELDKIKEEYFSNLKAISLYKKSQSLIYSSAKMEITLNLAEKVAGTDAAIFITGESGVGKEEIAKYIHSNSARHDKPFIAINCAAIPESLIESELFGYEGGAFTGANRSGKKGLLEEANGGTFFFDEIGELPIVMQSKLLRVVQESKAYRVGSTRPILLDVRYISATNLTKEQLEDAKQFRRDLYYRLCVVPISIPPLRERPDDIIPLVSHFLEMYNHKYDKNVMLENNVMRMLTQMRWEGNVRELKNVIERLVILANNDTVAVSGLSMATDIGLPEADEPIQVKEIMPLAAAHEIVDNILINKAYAQSNTIVEAARKLQIDPSTIHRKINAGKISIKNKII